MDYSSKEDRARKKPKSGKSRAWAKYKTNSTSVTGSRPTPAIERIWTKADSNDIVHYSTVDRTVTYREYRKTFAPNLVSFNPQVRPNQGVTTPAKTKSVKRNNFPLKVCLPNIYENLILANYDWVSRFAYDVDIVLNMCDIKIPQSSKLSVYNISISDDSKQPYHVFKTAVLQAIEIIENAVETKKSIVVNCLAGVNRSAAIVVAYAVLKKGWDISDAIRYIEEEKNKYRMFIWDTLTNKHFKRYIQQMLTDFKS